MTIRLNEAEFAATFSEPMRKLPPDASPPFEFWSYFSAIPPADFEGYTARSGQVSHVWENSTGRFQHVLVNTTQANVFMVLVLDVDETRVLGHRLLDLSREYGLDEAE